ncbi:MAG: hypothetical protein C7B46_18660 [Sulfobacillus benefaciens]|uniref:Guanylate kinase-like domain-containing protein n=1 Tax=Sulfobacillus benefaciens TaxID=453960 RepID=A0A2T2X495_9FIRM|nr:MAG: hypothetical protein C7B46_18660 [Sulfobacillus benefaciens]
MTGCIFVLIGPSGVGKTTLASLAHSDGLAERIITCTTRSVRPNESPGQDYFFFTLDEFTDRERNGEFVENEWIHGYRYGVLIRELSEVLQSGHRAVISLGYGGAERLKHLWPDQVTILGILPPSSDSLRQRLKARGTQDAEMLLRLRAIDQEFHTVQALADYMVVNDQLATAYQQLQQILSVGASSLMTNH